MAYDASSRFTQRDLCYAQSTNFSNLPHLLESLNKAQIAYKLVRQRPHIPRQATESCPSIVQLRLWPEGYEKFQQVFVGQRCMPTSETDEYTFWDIRTGLTLHISIVVTSQPTIQSNRYPRRRQPTAV